MMPCFDHPSATTCADFDRLNLNLPAVKTKNLFLRDKKGTRHFLLAVEPYKKVDLASLASAIGVGRLGMASERRLDEYLGVLPGSVSILALFQDTGNQVELIMDEALWEAPAIQAHPMKNTKTLIVSHANLRKFLEVTKHKANVISIPETC